MVKKYGNAQQRIYRNLVERFGNITWSTENDEKLCKPYQELVDMFGDRLNDSEKSGLVKIMCRNTGYSDDFKCRRKKSPMTLDLDGLAVIINPNNIDSGGIYHEGVHFLARYGRKKDRIIKKDIPLAKVIGTFIRLQENP